MSEYDVREGGYVWRECLFCGDRINPEASICYTCAEEKKK